MHHNLNITNANIIQLRLQNILSIISFLILLILQFFLFHYALHKRYYIIMSREIKKSHFKYLKCAGGNLHQGETMNLVCIDEKCQHRGIICPICKMQSHDDHYILPIKSFLDQIDDIFMNKEGNQQPSTIGDYLQGLQTGRRQLLSIVKKQIVKLSEIFKQIQCKIQTVYMNLRRNILIQSSLNTKLPTLIELMKKENNYDDFTIQNQFKKYCELIKVKDNKIKISDKSKKVVEIFKEMPIKISEIIESSTEQYKNKAKQLLSTLDNQTIEKKIIGGAQNIFKFSLIEKSQSIDVNEGQNEATGKQNCSKGFVFVDKPFTKDLNKVIFQVGENTSYELLVAIANQKVIKQFNYSGDSNEIKESVQIFFVSDGFTNKNQEDGDGSNSSVMGGFPFNESGAQVQVTYLSSKKAIQFKNLKTLQSFQLQLKQDINNKPEWKLCFGMNQNDKIILKQAN